MLEGLEAGALTSVASAATYSGFIHFIRIFGGQAGVAFMIHFISVREKLHSNLLGLHLQSGNWLSEERLRLLTAGMHPASAGADEAQYRAIAILSQQVRAQAYTLAIADGFILACWMAAVYLVLMLFLRPPKLSFLDLSKMP